MSSGGYIAAEDSALLRKALEGYSGAACLEIGAGNCGNLEVLAANFTVAVGTDIALPRSGARPVGCEYLLADSAGCFRSGSFDLVAFNPPYVPTEAVEDRAVDGGAGGVAVALRFLSDALRVVKRDGKVVMLLSSDDRVSELERACRTQGYEMKKVSEKRFFYETLAVYEAAPENESIARREAAASGLNRKGSGAARVASPGRSPPRLRSAVSSSRRSSVSR